MHIYKIKLVEHIFRDPRSTNNIISFIKLMPIKGRASINCSSRPLLRSGTYVFVEKFAGVCEHWWAHRAGVLGQRLLRVDDVAQDDVHQGVLDQRQKHKHQARRHENVDRLQREMGRLVSG